jgi:hypothetical protein
VGELSFSSQNEDLIFLRSISSVVAHLQKGELEFTSETWTALPFTLDAIIEGDVDVISVTVHISERITNTQINIQKYSNCGLLLQLALGILYRRPTG